MDKSEVIIKPFLKWNQVFLVTGTHAYINSRFAFGICYDLINNDTFLDTFDISKSNRPKNILIIKDNESKFEIEARYYENYRNPHQDKLTKTFSHLYFVDKYDLKNKNLNEAIKLIESKIIDYNIELVALNHFKFFKNETIDEVFSALNTIIKYYQLPLIVVSNLKKDNTPEDYINNLNPLCKYSDEIIYLINNFNNIKMCHLKSAEDNLENEISLRMDDMNFYRVFLGEDKSYYDILLEVMKMNNGIYERKIDLIRRYCYKLRAYNKFFSRTVASRIINNAIESGKLETTDGDSNNLIISLPNR